MKVVSLLSSFCATRPASKEISSELFTDILAHRKLGEIFQSYLPGSMLSRERIRCASL